MVVRSQARNEMECRRNATPCTGEVTTWLTTSQKWELLKLYLV